MSDFPAYPYPWQQSLWRQLDAQIEAGKLPHALLLAGPPGIGKRHLAEALTQRLLCQQPSSGSACGRCRTCELNRAGTHPDRLLMTPEEGSRAIKVDQVRQVIDQLGKTAQQGGRRVVLLYPAEAMNVNAANALLKALEEPAPETVLVLVSDSPGAVLPTIRSRCQLQLIPVPPAAQVLPWLEPLVAGSELSAQTLLASARGAPLAALALLAGDTLERRAEWQTLIAQLSLGQVSAVEAAAKLQGDDLDLFLRWWLGWLHDLCRWQLGLKVPVLAQLEPAVAERLQLAAPSLLQRYQEKLLGVRKQLRNGANPNKPLVLEEAMMDWTAILRASARNAAGQA
ncbi:DNA polymerase III subunit delta' [Marinimicrobium alkaliphilum]|uniref:DNA polymerase III subunit delta' n=1 Tax=Marinimicrobium alkaliphilum TaxID=2202654 RepID=UPI000DB9DC25|nr:DNA polymerase III subunit delta' [Marinimicrobium alkaliphilum]